MVEEEEIGEFKEENIVWHINNVYKIIILFYLKNIIIH